MGALPKMWTGAGVFIPEWILRKMRAGKSWPIP